MALEAVNQRNKVIFCLFLQQLHCKAQINRSILLHNPAGRCHTARFCVNSVRLGPHLHRDTPASLGVATSKTLWESRTTATHDAPVERGCVLDCPLCVCGQSNVINGESSATPAPCAEMLRVF